MRNFLKIYIGLLLILLGVAPGWSKPAVADKQFTVVIDAGHGGKDIGATDNGVMEKNINLKVAKQLEALIKKKMKGADVVMTRNADTYLTLQQRADKANKAKGDIFISIHTNSVDKKNRNRKSISGSSVYTLGLHKDESNLGVAMRENSVIELEQDYQQKYSGFDPQRDESYIIFEMAQKKNLSQSIRFAESVQKELVKAGRNDRGVHQAGFWVLWATSMPSVLVELDFICNPESARYISSDKGAKELAEAIFKALQKYEQTWSKTNKGVENSDLGDTYIEGMAPELEESFTISSSGGVAKARTRTHLSAGTASGGHTSASLAQAASLISGKKVTGRRRRSARSRELSSNKDFEKPSLYFPLMQNYGESSISLTEALASLDNKSNKEKPLTKAEKKKLEKEEKEAKKRAKELEKEAKKAEKKRKANAHNAKVNKLITVYKIQVLASTDLLKPDNTRFCGLTPITTLKENNLYKYYYGESTNRQDLEAVLADVKQKIPDAFIVASQKSVSK